MAIAVAVAPPPNKGPSDAEETTEDAAADSRPANPCSADETNVGDIACFTCIPSTSEEECYQSGNFSLCNMDEVQLIFVALSISYQV